MTRTTPAPHPSATEPRPRDLSPQQLGYTPQRQVAWLRPQLLASTGVRVAMAQLFGAYLDKRELQAALPGEVFVHQADGDFWIDYVADLGDGFDATYSIAWLLAQSELRVADPTGAEHVLPRGEVLVMGGDQVYPTADWRQYEDRCKGPYRSALPELGPRPPTLYALPGNHDWYDGLTAFLRLFGRKEPFGGWQTRQTRSYFAVRLPHRWWLFAIDAQFDAYLDEPQLEYFFAAAKQVRRGDRVIVCAARPTWVHSAVAPHEYDTLDYFLRRVVAPTGAEVAVMIAGDSHHYARYAPIPDSEAVTAPGGPARSTSSEQSVSPSQPAEPPGVAGKSSDATHPDVREQPAGAEQPDGPAVPDAPPSAGESATAERSASAGRPAASEQAASAGQSGPAEPPAGARQRTRRQLITCGGGGAYLAATHTLPETIEVPPRGTLMRHTSARRRYRLAARYPDTATSKRYARGVFRRLPLRNPGFGSLLAIMHTLLLAAYVSATSGLGWFTVPALGMSAVVIASGVGFASADRTGRLRPRYVVAGFLHGVAHLGLGVLGTWLWTILGITDLHPVWRLVIAVGVYAPLSGFLATQLVCLYLLIAHRFGVNVNELYAGQGIEDAKSFLRMRISADGSLTIYPVAVDRICRRWRAAPDDPPDAPWIAPVDPPRPRLAEPPVQV